MEPSRHKNEAITDKHGNAQNKCVGKGLKKINTAW